MSNSVNLTLDVTKTGIQNPLIKVRQGDGGFETLHTTVTSNGEPLDLQGWTITFMGTTAGNHKIVDSSVKTVEAPNGIFDYTPSKAWGMDIGEFKNAYFKFVKGNGSASSANFRVNVIEAVDLTQEKAKDYISVVDATIAEVRGRLESSLADVSSSVAATSMAVSVASSAVNNVASVASSAVANVNSAADVYVKKSGSETIDGDKTFTGNIKFSGNTNIVSATTRGEILDGYDLNGYTDIYKYTINGAKNIINYPSGASDYASLEVEKINGTTTIQRLMDTHNHIFVRRLGGNPATWSAWSRVDTGYLDQLTTWETPVLVPIKMTGPFANTDHEGYITYQGSLISFNFGGKIGSLARIDEVDLVIGQLPSGVPLPISTIRGFINDVSSSKAPTGAIRINTSGSITMNVGDAYTPKAEREYWEMSATGFTKAVFAPLSNSSYQNVVEFSPTSSTQGAAFTKDYYFAMSINSTDAGLVVYDRNKQTSQLVSFSNGPSNSGFTGHANDLAVLQDNSATNGSIWIGASHLRSPGMPIISYNPANGTVTKQGRIAFTTDETTPKNLIISTIIHVDKSTSEIMVSGNGKYWKGTFDKRKLTENQNITVTEIGANMLSTDDYAGLIGSKLSSILSVGQADCLEGDKFYKVRTAKTSTTLSVVIEFIMVNKIPKPTGRYWMTNYPSWSSNEIEKVWVENSSLYANINRNTVNESGNIIAKLADL